MSRAGHVSLQCPVCDEWVTHDCVTARFDDPPDEIDEYPEVQGRLEDGEDAG